MTCRSEDDARRDEQEFIQRVREIHTPAALSADRRSALLSETTQRLTARPRRAALIPALLAPVVAAAAAWLYLGAPNPAPEAPPRAAVTDVWADAGWAYDVLYPPELGDAPAVANSAMLPEEYAALESALFGI
jgi:hypothetical protein